MLTLAMFAVCTHAQYLHKIGTNMSRKVSRKPLKSGLSLSYFRAGVQSVEKPQCQQVLSLFQNQLNLATLTQHSLNIAR